MKYKHIPAALHNFGASFISIVNIVEDECIVDILLRILPRRIEAELRIHFPSGIVEPAGDYPPPLLKSIRRYAELLPHHLRRHRIEPSAIHDAWIIVRLAYLGLEGRVVATDDRGKDYDIQVKRS